MKHEHLLAGLPYPGLLRPSQENAGEEGELESSGTFAPAGGGTGPGERPSGHGARGAELALGPERELGGLEGAIWNLHDSVRTVHERLLAFPSRNWHAVDRVVLSAIPNPDGYTLRGNPVVVQGRQPTRRVTIYNPTQAVLMLGESAGTALNNPAIVVPALSVMEIPWNADDVELATDPGVLQASDLAPILVVRSDRQTDVIRIDKIGNTVGGFTGPNGYGSTAPLAAAGVYTSPAIPASPGFSVIRGAVFSDVAGNIAFQVWIAGAWRQFSTQAIVAGVILSENQTMGFPWGRFVVTNGGAPQTVFEFAAWPEQ